MSDSRPTDPGESVALPRVPAPSGLPGTPQRLQQRIEDVLYKAEADGLMQSAGRIVIARRILDAIVPPVQESVFLALVGARYGDGGHVLDADDARILTGRVMQAWDVRLADQEASNG